MRYKLNKSANAVFSLYYHLICVTKYRREVFHGVIAETLKDIIYAQAQGFDVEIICQETAPDYVHVLFTAKPTLELTKFINSVKGVSSRVLRAKFPDIKTKLWRNALWARSYCLITTGQVSLDVLQTYVASQSPPDTRER
ncbi:MAG: IS200/IS605 family transposase [Candidatus Hermodarchaeota archaeon]